MAFVALLLGAASVKTMIWADAGECAIEDFPAAFEAWDRNGRLANSRCYDMWFRDSADLSVSQDYAEKFGALMAENSPRQGCKISLHDPELQEMVGIPDSMFGVYYGEPIYQINEEAVHWLITAVETVKHTKRRGESLKAGDLISAHSDESGVTIKGAGNGGNVVGSLVQSQVRDPHDPSFFKIDREEPVPFPLDDQDIMAGGAESELRAGLEAGILVDGVDVFQVPDHQFAIRADKGRELAFRAED